MLDIGGIISSVGNLGISAFNNEENQALKTYLAGKTLADQKEIQQQMLSFQNNTQRQAYAQSLLDKAKKSKYIPYYVAGGVLLLTIGITLFVVFSKKQV